VVVDYQRFGTNYRVHIQGSSSSSSLMMGPIGCPETSVLNYHSTLRKISKKSRSWVNNGGIKDYAFCCTRFW